MTPRTEAGRRLRAALEAIGVRDPERGMIVDAEAAAYALGVIHGRDAALAASAPVAEELDVEALRAEIEAELEMVPRRKRPQFDAGAAAAYNFVLSLLPPPLVSEVERGQGGAS